ncbi:uncharacterized protein LOC131029587 isoform X1 [Cryptomeria japonica]|uniref:uncharacterized protein LOC131029587 isoform X1 n=2 Tax=Cryptomeria japonica TaxID=3369 RepID=UPI0027D9F5A1|nr:uncharacterized protein LOC131029587 isoform X1 [Cryptomeria japonica]XP_057816101.2 uncharacterized protein LOC131029587 isoform X1 [Cryptomeria japonica]XP_057816102.2 uncharacterized protein LOC131029587 isoform X1 [Cryptomeria japonica]XP_057816104.2 uncharacterized protein LOC131029587 isoform X1 [Cryptomeria japonica]
MASAVRIGSLVPECNYSCSKIQQRRHHFTSMPKTFAIAKKENQNFQILTGLRDLARSHQYKAWLLDQFGVLHDGQRPYPGAVATLEQLAHSGAKMVIVSNSSRRSWVTMEKMTKLGFDPSLFVGAITSGELTHQFLLRRNDPWFAALGRRCIHMTWSDRGAISLEGLDLQIVEHLEAADFILAHGTEAIGLANDCGVQPMKLDELEEILEHAVDKGIPMIIANPDHVTVEARALSVMPGTLGSKYEKMGGQVRWMGKPDQVIYEAAKEMTGVDATECIAVGDSLHHDILGANNSDMQSVFVAGGIHANELGITQFGMVPERAAFQALTHSYGAYPSCIIPSFTW